CNGDGLEGGFALHQQLLLQRLDGEDVGQVALVELQDVRDRGEIQIMIFQVLAQVVERFEVGVEPLFLGIRDEDDAVGALQNQAPAGLIKNLAWNGVKMEARLKAAHGSEVERKKIEEKSAVGFGGERNHLSLLIRVGMLVHPLQVRSLPAKAGTVVDKFAVNFPRGKINKRHEFPQSRAAITYSIRFHAGPTRWSESASQLTTDWGQGLSGKWGRKIVLDKGADLMLHTVTLQ